MAKRRKRPEDVTGAMLVIDLTGSNGNAFTLLTVAKQFSRSMGLDAKAVQQQMMSGDYANLVRVFSETFGEHVQLIRR